MIQKLENNVHSVKSVVQLGPFPDAKKSRATEHILLGTHGPSSVRVGPSRS